MPVCPPMRLPERLGHRLGLAVIAVVVVLTASALALQICDAATEPVQEAQFRSAVDLVPLYVTVTDRHGALVGNLDADNFSVHDNGQAREIALFQRGDRPISMAVLLDRSPSLFDQSVRTESAVVEFAQNLRPGDRACLGFFSHVVTLDPTLTDNTERLLKHLGDPAPLPAGTALWDALGAARAALASEGGRRAILLVTDANDNCSRADVQTVRELIEKDGLLLYVVAVRGRDGLQSADLETLARSTGGSYTELKPMDDVAGVMRRIANELHQQYILAFRPTKLDDSIHRLNVQIVGRAGLTARARRVYVASSR